MPAPGEPHDDLLRPLYAAALAALPAAPRWFDVHAHIGHDDPDGFTATPEDIVAGLDRAGHDRALIFPMHEPGGYGPANDRVLDACERSGGRLVPVARLDPAAQPGNEARRCLELGAAGFKLHPRSERFTLDHPGVAQVIAIADEARAPVVVHAGRGIPHLGEDAVSLARRHPGARIVLAHAGISDLAWLGGPDGPAADLPNLFFDTSWWQVDDLLALFLTVPPGRILYGSDMPYGSGVFGGLAVLRCARAAGLGPDAVAAIAGGQLERLVAGAEPVDVGAIPGPERRRAPDPHHARAASWLTAAVQLAFRGGDPGEPLALARMACRRNGHDALLEQVDALIQAAQRAAASANRGAGADRPEAVVYPAMAAELLAGTGGLEADPV